MIFTRPSRFVVLFLNVGYALTSWAANQYTVLHNFVVSSADGNDPVGAVVFDNAGNLYGVTLSGAARDEGIVFQLVPNADGTWTENVVKAFNGQEGGIPTGSLVRDAAGNLYGTTSSGGSAGKGVVFELSPQSDGSWHYTILFSFSDRSGEVPDGITLDKAGNFYGTTTSGGLNKCGITNCGTVFQLTQTSPGVWAETVLYNFGASSTDGNFPNSTVALDRAGNLYGVTRFGGTSNQGTVYQLTPGANGQWTETVLHSFSGGADGALPEGDLAIDSAGNLYGTALIGGTLTCGRITGEGCGTVFKLSNSGGAWDYTVIKSFTAHDGNEPAGRLVFDPNGNLYGTTQEGGAFGYGLVFKLTPNPDGSWRETTLHSFNKNDGDLPRGGVTLHAGSVWGTTSSGGSGRGGVAFQISH
ncbi:MAG TPA: choice-of-anchor tandem repeat GloVer-containing protein [Terriglobales bacterium]|nr:choice-of-anchor tandem repeat GloVer-containing protein [Terriglobales bacterium]